MYDFFQIINFIFLIIGSSLLFFDINPFTKIMLSLIMSLDFILVFIALLCFVSVLYVLIKDLIITLII